MKLLIGLCLALFLCGEANAQEDEKRKYELSVGIGAATNYYEDFRGSSGSGMRLSVESDVSSFLGGKLKLGLSGMFSGTSAGFEVQQFKAKYYWRNYALAVRGVLAFPINSALSAYGGLHLGIRSTHFHYTSTGSPGTYVVPNYTRVNGLSGAFLGVDYKWTDKFFIFSEAGYDQLWFTLGVKLKL